MHTVLGLIYTNTVNGGRTKVLTLKNKKKPQERMDKANLHLTCLFLDENNNFKRLSVGTFHLLYNYVMTKYDLHYTSFSIPVDTIRGRSKYGTIALKPGPLAIAYQI